MKEKKKKIVDDNFDEGEIYDERDFYAAEEQGIDQDLDSESIEEEMEQGKKDEDIYTKEGQDKLEEDDEIDAWEEGFMQGAEGEGQLGKDALTGEPLMDIDEVVEIEIEGEMFRFVNNENAEKFRKKKEEESLDF